MKIVQVCPYDIHRSGGVQRHIWALTSTLRSRGHEMLIVAPGPSRLGSDDVYYLGRRREVGMSGTRFEVTWATDKELTRLMDFLTGWAPDILHFHTLWSPAMPLQAFKRWNGASVTTFHDTPPPGPGGKFLRLLFQAMSRAILARVDGAIAVSQSPMKHLRPGANGVRPVILPPAMDLKATTALQARRPSNEDALQVLFVGRLERRKGIHVLLQAWERVLNASTLSHALILTIAGKGEFGGAVRDAQKRFGAERLRFVEAPDDAAVAQLYGDADIFVAPSPFGESFGIVLVEAMANALPVIAADNAGYSSVLTGQGAVGLVQAGDAASLANAILRFVADKKLREGLAKWGVAEAAQYDISAVAPRFEAIYRQAIEHHSVVPR